MRWRLFRYQFIFWALLALSAHGALAQEATPGAAVLTGAQVIERVRPSAGGLGRRRHRPGVGEAVYQKPQGGPPRSKRQG
jgi:hypothetical protein